MGEYQQNYQEELAYLQKTLTFLRNELERQQELLSERKRTFRAAGKDMWEDSAHSTLDFDKLTEVNQYLSEVSNQAVSYGGTAVQIQKFKKMLSSPYFGRFDFEEEDLGDCEKIYLGLHNVMDPKTQSILVYDWRAPVSSIFYQYELGKATYKAPFGVISGNVLLKRQYKILDSKLKYFFDCSIKIDDEILQEVLCQNSSVKMRSIVETIQREQDSIIRDTDSELLIVQGVAGSGKTSVALHRVAFLLYQGLNSQLNYNNILIISPNPVFSKYISSVLPELGEENVGEFTFEEYAAGILKEKGMMQTRNCYLEMLMSKDTDEIERQERSTQFKGSEIFIEILNRYIAYYERYGICFEDVYYDGKVIETRQLLKELFLDNKIGMPPLKRLKRIENVLLDRIRPLQKKRLEKIQTLVQKMEGHDFEIKPFSRLMSIKESRAFLKQIHRFTEIDYYQVYCTLFKKKDLFTKLAQGLALPEHVLEIIETTARRLDRGCIDYEDCAPMLYLKLKLEGSDQYSDIKQVIVDEAQDYSPMHYAIFDLLFKDASYTVLGDVNQSIERDGDLSLYDAVEKTLGKKKAVKITLNRSYRSSLEINTFSQTLLNTKQDIIPFERHEAEPVVVYEENQEALEKKMLEDIHTYLEAGYESIAVLSKTTAEAAALYEKLKSGRKVQLITTSEGEVQKGVMILPAYMAKGLEFDVVLVANASQENYSTELDRRLLYIASTRALHRLGLYHCGKRCRFIK